MKCTEIYPGERKVAAHDSDGSIWRTMWVAIDVCITVVAVKKCWEAVQAALEGREGDKEIRLERNFLDVHRN